MNDKHVDNLTPAYERELNEALVNADIANSYEEFLAIFDRFYAEQVEVASDSTRPASGENRACFPSFSTSSCRFT